MTTFVLFVRRNMEEMHESWHSAFGPFESDKEINNYLRSAGYQYIGGVNPNYRLWQHTERPDKWAKVAHELTPPEKLPKGNHS